MDIRNKVVIITGASAGIGLATAHQLIAAGAKVVLAARSTDKLDALCKELQGGGGEAIAITTDMRNKDDIALLVQKAFDHFGRIDVLINNAGQGMAGFVESATINDYQKLLELNVFGPVLAMQAVIPKMRAQGSGIIVNVSSMVSKMHITGLGFYASTKSALNMFSETARFELEKDNIKVLTVFPRMTSTEFGKNSLGNQQVRQQQRAPHGSVPIDSADHVASRILLAIETEAFEQYMDK
jgi:short-subunit dehydrogenase